MLLNVLQTKLYIVLSDAIMLHDIQRKARSLNRGSLPLGFLLALIGSEKESNDLCAGAAIVRSEQLITNAVGDAVLHRPWYVLLLFMPV